ncbi:MAG: microcin C ABC transporter permease YejB [Candidatus Symbiobacter sp.]|nr:microcin C ABC transporter permease YejB [Candidatus Symbiobacter sp.]
MSWYFLRRILLMIPTLLGIMVVNFVIIQAAPGGPVDRTLAAIKGQSLDPTARFTASGDATAASSNNMMQSRANRGLSPELVERIKKIYGFDEPPFTRFIKMIVNYLQFDFGKSFYSDRTVIGLILDKLPVSLSLGLWSTLLIYGISIPLGIAKAARSGSKFDLVTSTILIIFYAIPGFLLAIMLVILFAGGSYWSFFPLRGLVSSNWAELGLWARMGDYLWHMVLPITALVVGGFASLTFLTKNSFIDEMGKLYVTTARAKGLSEGRILYRHVFRNAMLLVISGFPAALIGILFTGALLVEVIFSLDGLGLLGFEAAVNRDFPVIFASVYIFSLMGLILNLLTDFVTMLVDPRIDYLKRG